MLKPKPAILSEDKWHPDQARKELVKFMEATDVAIDYEGHIDRPLSSPASLGMVADRYGSDRAIYAR